MAHEVLKSKELGKIRFKRKKPYTHTKISQTINLKCLQQNYDHKRVNSKPVNWFSIQTLITNTVSSIKLSIQCGC